MKFERIYMGSGTNKKADSTDYVNYYKAENGMIIQIAEPLNMSGRWYEIYASSYDRDRALAGEKDALVTTFFRLGEAKEFVNRYIKILEDCIPF